MVEVTARLSWLYFGLTAYVRSKNFRDENRAVGLLVDFENRDQDSRAGDAGVVEGVAEFLFA